jgi:hypothetical protein
MTTTTITQQIIASADSTEYDIDPRVLDLMAASYGKSNANDPDEVVSVIVHRNATQSLKARANRASAVKTTDDASTVCGKGNDARPAIPVAALSTVGTLDARGFMLAIRRATNREESIQAIAGYVGYDRNGNFGAQELAARMKATNELKAAVKVVSSTTVQGTGNLAPVLVAYVAGIPDQVAKRIANLEGQERLIGESVADHEKAAANEELDAADRFYHRELAKVDRMRLVQIRKDLEAYSR